jgi:hypothetical protein
MPSSSCTAQAAKAAMEGHDDFAKLSESANDLSSAGKLFASLNARLFFRFVEMQHKKRVVNKVSGGMVTYAEAQSPVALYNGPTCRRHVSGSAILSGAGTPDLLESPGRSGHLSGGEGESLGNVNRGEPRCTFVNEIIGLPLALSVFPRVYDFPGDALLELVEPGLYRKAWRTSRSNV